jgi:hypothetical protein
VGRAFVGMAACMMAICPGVAVMLSFITNQATPSLQGGVVSEPE